MATDPKFSLRAWLNSFNQEKHLAVFEKHGVVSHQQCSNLAEEDLRSLLGITDANDVHMILLEADDLKCNSMNYITSKLLHEPLYEACKNGDMDKVKWLVDEGANVNWKNKYEKQRACLHITAQKGHTDILKFLICLPEVVVDIRDKDGNTAAHYSARSGRLDAIKILYQHDKALFSLKDKVNSRTPLNEAEYWKQTSVVDYIVAEEQLQSKESGMTQKASDLTSTSERFIKISNPRPTLLELKRMKGADGKPIDVIKSIAATQDVMKFGMFLLEDENGQQVDLIKKDNIQEGAESVTEAIFKKWLRSDTCTYQHLIKSLKEAEFDALAANISQVVCV